MGKNTAAIILAFCALTACDPTAPDYNREPAVLGNRGVPVRIVVPDTVTRGQPFTMSLTHYGSSSCKELELEVNQAGPVVTLRPFRIIPKNTACTDDFAATTVNVNLTFTQAGQTEIRTIGRFEGRDTTVVRRTFVR